MSGISHLQDLYHKKGNDFINNLFDSFVTVNEKMDGSAFTFERDPQRGNFNFYKRDQRNPITLVDRTLMKYYEKPIQHIESLPPHIIKEIPRGWRFGLEYFATSNPVEIAYDRVPKNNLILSYVHKIENGKIKETIQDKKRLDEWADILGVERPPIIFQGYLSEEQKRKILEFVNTPFSDLVSEFKTKSFVTFIIGVLNPELKNTTLNNDLEKAIEGVVFRFGGDTEESEPVLAKMVDPVFTELAKSKYVEKKDKKPSDFLGISVLDVMNFILERGVESFEALGSTEDERYLSFMSDVFVKFLDEYKEKYKDADFDEPEYLKREDFRVNKKMISNREALSYIEENEAYESLFKLIVNQFRKIKKRTGGIISQGVIEQFNLLIKEIEDLISKKENKINESEIPSFRDFKNLIKKKVEYMTEESESEESDIEPEDSSFFNFIGDLEKIRKTKIKNEAPLKEENRNGDLKPINVIVGRFQPFHKGHLQMAKELQEENGLPSLVAVVHPGHNKSGKSPFTQETVKKYMEAAVMENPELLSGFLVVTRGLLGIIAGEARSRGFKIALIGAGDDREEDYKKQVEYLKKAGKEFPDDAKVFKTKRSTSGEAVRKEIKRGDFTAFKKLVTPAVASLYSILASDLNGTSINESVDIENYMAEENKLEDLIQIIDKITESAVSLSQKDIDDASSKKIEKIISKARSAEFYLRSIMDKGMLPESLSESISLSLFGKKRKLTEKQNEYVEDFISSLNQKTFDLLEKRGSGLDVDGFIDFDSAVKIGVINILEMSSFNGVDKGDIENVYSMDSKFPSGRKRRGKGESLTAIAFGGRHYHEIEADVIIGESRVEVKTTMNSSLDTDSESQKLHESVSNSIDLFSQYLGESNETSEGKLQKTSFESLINSLSLDNPKSRNSFISKLKKILESKEIKDSSDIGPALICKQLDWYSESQGFDVLAIYVENNGFPEKLALLDGRGGFMNRKNFDILKQNHIQPRVTQGRMDIYNKTTEQ